MDRTEQGLAGITEAAVRPILNGGLRFWLLAGALGAVVAAAVAAWIYQLMNGLGVTGANDDVFWGIYEADLVAFLGVSYGAAVTSALLWLVGARWRTPIVRIAEALALVTVCVGALFAIIHVGRPERLWELVTRPHHTSPVTWDFVAITTYLVTTLVFLYVPLIPDLGIIRDRVGKRAGRWRLWIYRVLALGWRDLPSQRRLVHRCITVMSVVTIPVAMATSSVLAWAFGVTVREGWHSTILAPYFVIGALLSGVAMVILVVAAFRWAYHLEQYITLKQFRYLAYLMLALGFSYLYLNVAELLTASYALDAGEESLQRSVLVGSFAPLFWGFLIGGGLIPTVLVILPWTRTVPGITLAATLAVIGMWVKRTLIVVPTLSQPFLGAPAAPYHPTIVEILITLGATAMIPLLLMLFFRVFPVLSIDQMQEAAETEALAERAAAMRGGLRVEPRVAAEQGGVR